MPPPKYARDRLLDLNVILSVSNSIVSILQSVILLRSDFIRTSCSVTLFSM